MKSRRLLGIAALGAAAASMVMVPGVGAQEATATYSGSSTGRALALNVGPEGLTLGQTTSAVNSTPEATAAGAGVANPVSPAGASEAKAASDGETAGSAELTCQGELPEIPLLALGLACSASEAAITAGIPTASSRANVGAIQADPVSPLLGTPLSAVVDGLDDGVDQLLEGLKPITGPIDENTGLGLDDTLNKLFDELFDGAPLLTLTLGDTTTTSTVTGNKVVTACTAEGARIDVLDPPAIEATDNLPAVDPDPVLTIIVGEASTTVSADLATEEPTVVINPSLVTVIVPTSETLARVELGPGDTQVIELPDPLGKQTIAVAGPEEGQLDDGQTYAQGSAVRIHLLESETFQGGIELALADCYSVAGADAPEIVTTTSETTQPPLLPRTGTDGPNTLALASAFGFAGLGFALLRRTRTTI